MGQCFTSDHQQKTGPRSPSKDKDVSTMIVLGKPLNLKEPHETAWENENSFIWKANNDDVTRGFSINIHDVGKSPPQKKYCLLIGAYEYKMKHKVMTSLTSLL